MNPDVVQFLLHVASRCREGEAKGGNGFRDGPRVGESAGSDHGDRAPDETELINRTYDVEFRAIFKQRDLCRGSTDEASGGRSRMSLGLFRIFAGVVCAGPRRKKA